MLSEYRYSPVESEVFQVIIWENGEGMTVLDYGVFILLVDLTKVRRKLVEKRLFLLQVMLEGSEILKHVYGI